MECTFLNGTQNVSAGINTLMSISDGLDPSYERRDEWKVCLFLARVGNLTMMLQFIKIFIRICTLTWRVDNFVSCQGKGINSRIESPENQ